MITINVKNLTKTYGTETIFKDVSFSIEQNEKVAIVGPNGCGKTTLFNVITEKEGRSSGEIYISKDLKIGYMEQNINLTSYKTVIDMALEVFEDLKLMEKEIEDLHKKIAEHANDEKKLNEYMKIYSEKIEEFEEKGGYSYNSMARGILIGLGFNEKDLDKKVDLLSGGEKSRLLLAKMLLEDSDILLLDEPTNHLDMDSISWLESFLINLNKTILIISHDRYFLDNLTTRTIDMSYKTAKVYNASYSKYKKMKEELFEKEIKDYELNVQEIKRQEEIIRKLKSFNREKQIKRAESREKALEKMERIEKPVRLRTKANIVFKSSIQSGKDVLKVENLSKKYGERTLFEDSSFDIYRGEKICLIGPNGSGKTTLFNILLGLEEPTTGDIHYGTNVNKKYFDQERTDLNENNTIIEEVWNEYPNLVESKIRTYLGGFLFRGDDVFKDISSLSGGEKSRVSLLKLMLSNANFLFMDEPTNHLDIDSKEVLEDAILSYDSTVFIISHDRYFLNKVPDRIFAIENGKIVEYLGNYDYMMEKREEKEDLKKYKESINKKQLTKTELKEIKRKEKEERKQITNLKKEEKNILKQISETEEKIKSLDNKLCLEEVYKDSEKTREIIIEKNALSEKIEKLYEKWEEITEILENS